jgi:hypothetical protein
LCLTASKDFIAYVTLLCLGGMPCKHRSTVPYRITHSVWALQIEWDAELWRETCTYSRNSHDFCGASKEKWENSSAHLPPWRTWRQVHIVSWVQSSQCIVTGCKSSVLRAVAMSSMLVILLRKFLKHQGQSHASNVFSPSFIFHNEQVANIHMWRGISACLTCFMQSE